MKKLLASTALGLAFIAGHAHAQEFFYIGGNLGLSVINGQNFVDNRNSYVISRGWTSSYSKIDQSSGAGKAFLGFRFTQPVGLELGLASLGSYSISTRGTSGANYIQYSETIGIGAAFVDGVFYIPVSDSVDLVARAGLAATTVRLSGSFYNSSNGAYGNTDYSTSKVVPKLGFGAQFGLTQKLAIRAEGELYMNVGDSGQLPGATNVFVISAGVKYGF